MLCQEEQRQLREQKRDEISRRLVAQAEAEDASAIAAYLAWREMMDEREKRLFAQARPPPMYTTAHPLHALRASCARGPAHSMLYAA